MSSPAGSVSHDDGYGHDYPYPPTGEPFTSVTTFLGATYAKPWIPPWASGITAAHDVDNLETLARIKAIQGRDAAVKFAKGESERIRDLKRDVGGYVHDVVRALVMWQKSAELGAKLALPELPEHLAGQYYDNDRVEDVAEWMIDGFLAWVSDFKPRFLASEMIVFHPGLRVAGALDAITFLPGLGIGRAGRFVPGPGVSVCDDIKTGKHLDITWPEQIGTYRRCPECLVGLGELYPTPPSEAGAVLHLRPEHPRCYRYMLISGEDDAKAWNRARRALELYEGRKAAKAKPGKVCYPLREDGTIQQPRITDLDGEGYGRAIGSFAKAGLGDIDLEQLAAMTAGQLLKAKHIGGKTVEAARDMLRDHGLHLKGEELLGVLRAVQDDAQKEVA